MVGRNLLQITFVGKVILDMRIPKLPDRILVIADRNSAIASHLNIYVFQMIFFSDIWVKHEMECVFLEIFELSAL